MVNHIFDIEILCHTDDLSWIKEQLQKCNRSLWQGVCNSYSKYYQLGLDSETVPHRKTNRARQTANTKLRAYTNQSR